MDLLEGLTLQQVEKKTLRQVLSIGWFMAATTSERVQWIPICLAEFAQRLLAPRHPALSGDKDCAPSRCAKARWIAYRCAMLRIHPNLQG